MGHRNAKAEEVRLLEELLESGDSSLYGQICWSLSNQSSVIPEPGHVIAVPTVNTDDQEASESFRLTDASIDNIRRCFGIKTCGEAVDLFTEKQKVQPWGECLNGHQEAAFQFLMYGIEPSERCADCGEVPNFTGVFMSPDIYKDGPVKGVDGQEYLTCPECGSGLLELEGESPVKWGWKIVCLECDWEVKQAENLDIEQYCDLMGEVKARVESVSQLIQLPGITNRTRVESISLQLRMILELIVFSSLVSNKDVWQRSQKELQSSQNINNKLRELKRLHPNFYPKPIDTGQDVSGEEPANLVDGFLTEDKLIKVYGQLGNVLHADNPLGKGTDYQYFLDAVPGWLTQVKNLLECHKVYLYHQPERFYLLKMFGDVDGELMCIPFKTTCEGKAKCAWPDCVSSSMRLYCEYIQRPWRECRLPELEPQQTESKEIVDHSNFDESQ